MYEFAALIAPYRKFVVAALTVAAALVTGGVLPAGVAAVVSTVISIAGLLGVYAVPNAPATGSSSNAAGL